HEAPNSGRDGFHADRAADRGRDHRNPSCDCGSEFSGSPNTFEDFASKERYANDLGGYGVVPSGQQLVSTELPGKSKLHAPDGGECRSSDADYANRVHYLCFQGHLSRWSQEREYGHWSIHHLCCEPGDDREVRQLRGGVPDLPEASVDHVVVWS